MMIKYAIAKEQDSIKRDMLYEKLRQLQQVFQTIGSEAEFRDSPVGFSKIESPFTHSFHREWLLGGGQL